MLAYNSETRDAQIQNKQTENEFASNVAATRSQLKSGVMDYFNGRLSDRESLILTTETETKTFNSSTLGLITLGGNFIR